MFKIPIAAVSGNPTVIGYLANPFGVSCLILRAWIEVVTQSGAACTLDIGYASAYNTSNDRLLDGISVATAGFFDSANDTDNGTNGVAKPQRLGATDWITINKASGNANALVGNVCVELANIQA